MKGSLLKILMLSSFILLLLPVQGWGESMDQPELEQAFRQAKSLLVSFKNDSSLLILNQILEELSEKDQLETSFGLRVRFRQAEALEKDHQSDQALQLLLTIQETSKKKEIWDVHVNAGIILARLYEKIGKGEDCIFHLRIAQSIIHQYSELDTVYPLLAIRLSSYHRIYSDKDSSLYYAKEVLRTAPIYDQEEETAVGHMLMGMLLEGDKNEERLEHFKAAGKTFKKLEDHTGYGYMTTNIARWHLNNGNLKQALLYNDSTMITARLSIEKGHEEHRTLYLAHRFRSEIFRRLGQMDSAWHYLVKGYEMELAHTYETNNEKVIEIDARYKDEQKVLRIAEQEKQIKYERDRRFFLIGIISLVILLASILAYYYLRLRRANRKTRVQALTIAKNNRDLSASLNQQLILQGEVHHRVKNNLQVIISLLELQQEDIEDLNARENLKMMAKRIYSMAAIHEILYQQKDMAAVNLYDYLENLCTHFSNFSIEANKPVFQIEMESFHFNLETSMPIGIMLTELLTNSLKYGRVKGQRLRIHIGLEKTDRGYCFIYKDNGPGFPGDTLEEREGGLGSYLLRSMSRQLSGRMECGNDNGVSYRIFFKEKNNKLRKSTG